MGKRKHALWDPVVGAFNARTETTATGAIVAKAGAECRFCGETCNNAELLRLLNHVCGESGKHGWKPCEKMPGPIKERYVGEYLAAVEEKENMKKAKTQGTLQLASFVSPKPEQSDGGTLRLACANSAESPEGQGSLNEEQQGLMNMFPLLLRTVFSTAQMMAMPFMYLAQFPGLHRTLDLMVAMFVFEGNIAPHAIQTVSGRTLFSTLGFWLRMPAPAGKEPQMYKPPSSQRILSGLLDDCYNQVNEV
jgi:hypothetical protein